MTPQWVAAWAAVAAVVLALLARWPGRFFWRLVRRTWQFLEDWNGEPERPGVKKRPGVMERLDSHDRQLEAITSQLQPNGGTSIYDKVTRIDDALPVQPTAIHIHTDGKEQQR